MRNLWKFAANLGIAMEQPKSLWLWELCITTKVSLNPHSALQLLRHVLVTKTRQFDDITDRNSLITVTQN